MKTAKRPRNLIFQMSLGYGWYHYLDQARKLERAVRRKTRALQIDLVGAGEISPDASLLMRSILRARPQSTTLITNARSSLNNSTVLIWLLGEKRIFREDAHVYFRPANLKGLDEAEPDGDWKEIVSPDTAEDFDPDEGDYSQVLKLIDEYLPVRELAGKLIRLPILKQFGLVENEQTDQLLTVAFSKSEPALVKQ